MNDVKASSLSSTRARSCVRRASVATAVSIALLHASASAVAADDDEQERIAALVAKGDSKGALPLALERARRLQVDLPAWEDVLKYAGWNSDQDAAVEALRHIVELRPGDRDRRLALAQRLLWAKQTKGALPHAKWLAARRDERDPVALEVATWIFLGENDREAAHDTLERWVAAAPSDPRPRWILADATHWTARWREAKAQYPTLLSIPSERAKAVERVEMLRHAHPDELRVDVVRWSDNLGVRYTGAAVDGTWQMPWPAVLYARAERGRWGEENGLFPVTRPTTVAPFETVVFEKLRARELGVLTAQARVRFEASDSVWPEVGVGVEADSASNTAPIGNAGVQLSIAGKIFGRVWVQHDRFRVSLEAARQNIRATGPAWSIYTEPLPWLFVSTEAALHWLSDSNLRKRVLLAVGAHNVGDLQIEPRVFSQYDRYNELRPGAYPYFTPSDAWLFGGDLTARYKLQPRLRADASLGVVWQGGTRAYRPGALVQAELADHVRVNLSAVYIGSAEYNQTRFDASLGYLF